MHIKITMSTEEVIDAILSRIDIEGSFATVGLTQMDSDVFELEVSDEIGEQ